MHEDYLSPYNKKSAIRYLKKVIEIGVDFKLSNKSLNLKSYDELYNSIMEELPESGMDLESLLDFVNKTIIPYSTNYASPFAMAFPDAGNSIAGIAGAILSDLLNQNLINWNPCSPIGTIVETLIINWLRELMNYPSFNLPVLPSQAGGIITSGGVASNTIAMILARENSFPGTMKRGIQSITTPFVSVIPEGIEHYSSRLSMGWLGMGEDNVVKVKTKQFKYDLNDLNSKLNILKQEGRAIISLTAYAGDSRSMTCDNFQGLREICDKHNIWFHVDGCHGTQLLFSDKHRNKISGIELADSVTFDPHKVLNLPYAISLILVKNPEALKVIQRPEDIITGEEHSFGQITPLFGSRPFQSLKLYMLLKNLGRCGLEKTINDRCAIAQTLANKIRALNDFVLVNPDIGINSVMFMFVPSKFRDTNSFDIINVLNTLNMNIQQALLEEGDVWLHNFKIPDLSNVYGLGESVILQPLRFMSGNPILTESHLEDMLRKVRCHGRRLASQMNYMEVRA